MVDFSNREEVEAWLRDQPREVAVTLAARAAGRVLPALVREPRSNRRRFAVLVLAVFRANALARAAAKYQQRASDIAVASSAASVSAAAYPDAFAAASAASVAASAFGDAFVASSAAAHSAAYLPGAMAGSAPSAGAIAAMYAVAAASAAFNADASGVAQRNVSAALWPNDPATHASLPRIKKSLPDLFANLWLDLKTSLLAREGENWSVWTDWYDAWLDGREQCPQLSPKDRENLDIAICLIPDEHWKDGAAHVNTIIRGMINAAVAKANEIPPQQAAAILPVWSDGKLIQQDRPVAEGRSAILLDAALLSLRETTRKLADDFDKWVGDCQKEGRRSPQVDRKPADHLRAVAALIPDETPSLWQAFEIFHARDALAGMAPPVREEWPEPLVARFVALLPLFDRTSRLSSEWQELMGTASRPSQADIVATPQAATNLIEILENDATAELVAPSLVARLKALVAPLVKAVSEDRLEPFGADIELLTVDVVNSIGNIVKRLAEAGVELKKLGAKAGKELWTGFRVNLPKQSKKLGNALAKVAIWGPVLGGGGWLAAQFEWFAPIWSLIKPFLK